MALKLGAVTFFARDLDALTGFYADALGLEETVNDAPRYRELSGGGAKIGFAFSGAYAMLSLAEEREPAGLRSIVTFVVDDPAAMEGAVERAVGCGGSVAKPVYETHFGQLMAVLRDPEGNAFRLTAALNP